MTAPSRSSRAKVRGRKSIFGRRRRWRPVVENAALAVALLVVLAALTSAISELGT